MGETQFLLFIGTFGGNGKIMTFVTDRQLLLYINHHQQQHVKRHHHCNHDIHHRDFLLPSLLTVFAIDVDLVDDDHH